MHLVYASLLLSTSFVDGLRLRSPTADGTPAPIQVHVSKIDLDEITADPPAPVVQFDANGNPVVVDPNAKPPKPAFEPNPDATYDIATSVVNSVLPMAITVTPADVSFCLSGSSAVTNPLFGCGASTR